jgi:hypothetical protein
MNAADGNTAAESDRSACTSMQGFVFDIAKLATTADMTGCEQAQLCI